MALIIYKTDNYHSYASRDILGICVEGGYIDIIKQQIEKEGEKLSEDDEYNLANIKQTQGYSGEGEFVLEWFETDELL